MLESYHLMNTFLRKIWIVVDITMTKRDARNNCNFVSVRIWKKIVILVLGAYSR